MALASDGRRSRGCLSMFNDRRGVQILPDPLISHASCFCLTDAALNLVMGEVLPFFHKITWPRDGFEKSKHLPHRANAKEQVEVEAVGKNRNCLFALRISQ